MLDPASSVQIRDPPWRLVHPEFLASAVYVLPELQGAASRILLRPSASSNPLSLPVPGTPYKPSPGFLLPRTAVGLHTVPNAWPRPDLGLPLAGLRTSGVRQQRGVRVCQLRCRGGGCLGAEDGCGDGFAR
ncbi:hypothetical protein VPH35_123665 [Triticum aestivum]